MAVAVPLVMAAAGAGTAAIVGTSLVLAATGVNSKIDRAASKVFGKDLVNVANIAGSAFLAFGGGMPSAGAGSSAGLGEAVDATGGMDTALGSTANTGMPTPVDATGGMDTATTAPANQVPMGALASVPPSGAVPPGGAATPGIAGQVQDGVARLGNTVGNAWDKGVAAFKGMSPQAQGALIQVAGGVLGGIGQAKGQEALMQANQRYDQRYRSGSGVKYWSPGSSYNGG